MIIPKPRIKTFKEQFEEFQNEVLKSLETTIWSSVHDPSVLKKIPDLFYTKKYNTIIDVSDELRSLFHALNNDDWVAKMTELATAEGYFIRIYPRGIDEIGYFRKPSAQ